MRPSIPQSVSITTATHIYSITQPLHGEWRPQVGLQQGRARPTAPHRAGRRHGARLLLDRSQLRHRVPGGLLHDTEHELQTAQLDVGAVM